jgi:signal-transduction protein with cAMP-binding, CBS, and nucleotidyltransferase domain
LDSYFNGVGDGQSVLTFKRNDTIFSQGDAADSLFYIKKGRVKISVVFDLGKEAVVAIMEAGQFFGESCLNGHSAPERVNDIGTPVVIRLVSKRVGLIADLAGFSAD